MQVEELTASVAEADSRRLQELPAKPAHLHTEVSPHSLCDETPAPFFNVHEMRPTCVCSTLLQAERGQQYDTLAYMQDRTHLPRTAPVCLLTFPSAAHRNCTRNGALSRSEQMKLGYHSFPQLLTWERGCCAVQIHENSVHSTICSGVENSNQQYVK